MCYHTSVKTKGNQIAANYNAPFPDQDKFEPIYHANGFALPTLPVLLKDNNDKQIDLIRWGYIPGNSESMESANKFARTRLNAMSEKVFYNSYGETIFTNRCIIPVTGIFESKHVGKEKVPYLIHPKVQPFFNLIGIYHDWEEPSSSQVIRSFAILTGVANEFMADIHNSAKRMPLMIDISQIDYWLDPSLSKSSIKEMMNPCDDRDMAAYEVSRILNKAKIDSNIPEILEEVRNPAVNKE